MSEDIHGHVVESQGFQSLLSELFDISYRRTLSAVAPSELTPESVL